MMIANLLAVAMLPLAPPARGLPEPGNRIGGRGFLIYGIIRSK